MSSAWYHVIVLGTDLAGLIYAALAAKAGYRVGVLGQGPTRNVYKHGTHTFLNQPERFYGFASSPVIARVLLELSMQLEMKNLPAGLDPTLQLVTPDMRLDVMGHGHLWKRELRRELPGFAEQFLHYEDWAAKQTRLSDAALLSPTLYPPSGLRAMARYKQDCARAETLTADAAGRTPSLLSAVRSQFPLLEAPLIHMAQVWGYPSSSLAITRLWTHLRAGLVRLPDGLDGLKQLFIRKIRDQCGDYRPNDAAAALIFKRGRVKEVVLDRQERLGCDMLILGCDPTQLLNLVPLKHRDHRYHRALTRWMDPQAWRLNINLAVDPQVVPEGMGTELLLVDPSKPIMGEHSLWLSRPGVGPHAKTEGRPGPETLMVSALLPSRGHPPTIGGLQQLMGRIMARLREFMPWLDSHLHEVHVPAIVRDASSGQDVVNRRALTPTMLTPQPGTLQIGAVPTMTAYKNIAIAANVSFSGLGFEGAFLAALQALEQTRLNIKLKSALR